MKYRNQLLVLAGVTVFLNSCSMLGNRKESTKLDLEGTSISQMRIIGGGGKTGKDETSQSTVDNSNNSAANPSAVSYEASFVDPKEKAKDYIEKNKIRFDHVQDKNQFAQGMDRASLFFDLGARLRANPEILPVNEENLRFIPAFEEQKVNEIRSSLNCGDDLQSFIIKGSASIDLDNTEIGLIMTEEEKEDYIDTKFDLATMGQIFFKHFSDDAKDIFFESFDPKLNEVKIGIAHQVEYCGTSEGGPRAYISDNKGYYPIEPGNISLEGSDIKLKFSRIVTKNEISSLQLNSSEVPTLDRVTFGVKDERIEVFGKDNLHQKNIIASFKAEKSADDPEAAANSTGTNTGGTAPTTPEPVEKKPTLPAYIPSLYISDDPNAGPITKQGYGSGSRPVYTNTDSPIVSNSPIIPPAAPMTDEEFNKLISDEPFFEKYKTEIPLTAGWFDPSIQGHSEKFYKYDPSTNRIVYSPGIKNVSPWNDDIYSLDRNPLKTTDQINGVCEQYKYSRDMKFDVTFVPTHNANVTDYVTLPNGEKKPYRFLLLDQLSLDVEQILDQMAKEGAANGEPEVEQAPIPANASADQKRTATRSVIMSIIDAAMTPSSNVQTQTWNLKVCFAKKDKNTEHDYRAFWSSNISATKYEYKRKVIASPRENMWIENSFHEDLDPGANLPNEKFNPRRKNPHSVFYLTTDSKNHQTNAVFQFKFPGEMEVETLMAYLNPELLSMDNRVFRTFLRIKKTGALTRNEIWITGGFNMDLKAPAQSSATYISPQTLLQNGLVTSAIYPPMKTTFPGDNSELEFEIFPAGYDIPNIAQPKTDDFLNSAAATASIK